MPRYLARRSDGMPLYWLDAADEASARAVIAAVDSRRPAAARDSFAAATLQTLDGDQFAALKRDVKARRLKTEDIQRP